MGSYARCWIGNFYVGSSKNAVDPGLMQLFRSSDKKTIRRKAADIPSQLRHWADDDEGGEEEFSVVYYQVPVLVARDRLELSGYTLDVTKEAFSRSLAARVDSYVNMGTSTGSPNMDKLFGPLTRLLRSVNVDSWLAALRAIREQGLTKCSTDGRSYEDGATLTDYMLEHNWYGYPGADRNVGLRLAMEVCSPADQVVYDVTELVISGYVSTEDDLVDDALSPGWSGYPVGGKVVVLTEGRSDSRIIADSLRLLYPHLLDYFTFMDFDGIRVAGGAGNLANIVKAFAAAGIVNRVLALFDNDTAGTEAVQMLRGLCIRGNIRIAQLPYLPALCSYPTIGPTGRVDMDVNGMAASIELYLGSDVLTAPSGQLSPVQWTGYNTRLRQYQGEVIGEEQIRERFLAKVESCRANADGADAADWTGIRAILHVLFNSFHDADRREILEFADEHPLE